jgi:hypothetical protein
MPKNVVNSDAFLLATITTNKPITVGVISVKNEFCTVVFDNLPE